MIVHNNKQPDSQHTGISGWLGPSPIYLACVFAFSLSFLLLEQAHDNIETLLLLIFFGNLFLTRPIDNLPRLILDDSFCRLIVALLLFLVVAQIWYHFTRPDFIDTRIKDARYYLKPVMVLAVALALYISQEKVRWWFLLSAFIGLVSYFLFYTNSREFIAGYSGQRLDFGIHNAQHAAMLFGTSLIGLMTFAPRAIKAIQGWGRIFVILALVAAISFSAFGVLATQVRAIWLGLLIAACVGVLLYTYLLHRSDSKALRGTGKKLVLYIAALGLFLTAILYALNANEIIENRLAHEEISISKIENAFSLEESPDSSMAVRISSWAAALQWISERPWFGWGPAATKSLIEQSEYFSEDFKTKFGHLHNSYLETLVANGLLGTLILAGLIITFGTATIHAYRNSRMPIDVFMFAWVFFAFWFIINMFESYILYSYGQYVNALVGGFIYAYCLNGRSTEAMT